VIRDKLYWLFDYLKGGKVREYLDDIVFQNENYESEKAYFLRINRLQNLLKYANENVPFYKNKIELAKLTSFPVVNKSVIRNDINNFLSTQYDRDKLYSTTTSGSTGTPFRVYKDKNKILRHTAENVYYNKIAGHKLGSRLYYLRVWNTENKKSAFTRITQNVVTVEISNLSDERIKGILEKLNKDKTNKSILSFASALEAISRYIVKYNPTRWKINLDCIMSMSESLPVESQMILEEFFSCQVVSRYSNMENGFIAQQKLGQNEYRINHAGFVVEILDIDNDKPIANGKLGRIVVTDLFNYAMPLIRYDTGDLGIIREDSVGPYFSSIEGRKVDFVTNTKGDLMSPHTITNTMWKYTDILQFQFIQKGEKEYLIKVNIDEADYGKKDLLISDLKSYLGDDATVEVEVVHEIPLLASGKRKKIVNEMKIVS
jgi:phenylacetate-coenzyme A ligase PaaK-like adenylate-forming protein